VFTRQNGDILIGDTSGYFDIQPDLMQREASIPIVMISNFLLNNIPYAPYSKGIISMALMQTEGIRLNHNQNTISFEFKNIDFSSDHEDIRLSINRKTMITFGTKQVRKNGSLFQSAPEIYFQSKG
jgi:hypothetical protein